MLEKKQKYLQIALNNTLEEARAIINQIPLDKRIIIEVGTPLIKKYGLKAITKIKEWWGGVVIFFTAAKKFYKQGQFFSKIRDLFEG